MKLIATALLFSLGLLTIPAGAQRSPSPKYSQYLQGEITHRILMLPYYGVFDAIGFKVDGYTVTLLGKVTRPSLKVDAEKSLKGIEGIEKINNQIEVLPASF